MGNYKKNLIITTLLFFVAVAISFGLVKIFMVDGDPSSAISAPQEPRKEVDTNLNSGPEVKIQPRGGIVFPLVLYKNGDFDPKELDVSPEFSTGTCLITVLNEDQENLILRLSPYSPDDTIGFKYDSVPSGERLILDPRYGDIREILFHNRKNPEAEFRVILDKTCL